MILQEKIKEAVATDYGLVSIIMPNYNGAKFLTETIESVLAQTYTNWELLFVDDCSTDNSLELIQDYKDDRIKVLRNEKNSGAAVSRNYALREATGKWIAFLDSDDLWVKDKLQKQLTFMVERKYDFTYTSYEHINENSDPLNVYVAGPKKIGKCKMFMYDYVGCLTVIFNAEKVGVIQVNPGLKARNDYAIWLKICRICNCYYLNEILAQYRIRKNSISHSGLKKLIVSQYKLFRIGEEMNPIRSAFHTGINIFFGVLKKMFYVKKV